MKTRWTRYYFGLLRRLFSITAISMCFLSTTMAHSLHVEDDAYVDESNPDVVTDLLSNDGRRVVVTNLDSDSGDLLAGERSGFFRHEFKTLPDNLLSENVIKGSIRLWVSEVTTPGDFTIHKVLQDWDETNLTFNNQPTFDPVPLAVFSIGNDDLNHWVTIDITKQVQEWALLPFINYGVVVKAVPVANNQSGFVTFSSKEGIYVDQSSSLTSLGPQNKKQTTGKGESCKDYRSRNPFNRWTNNNCENDHDDHEDHDHYSGNENGHHGHKKTNKHDKCKKKHKKCKHKHDCKKQKCKKKCKHKHNHKCKPKCKHEHSSKCQSKCKHKCNRYCKKKCRHKHNKYCGYKKCDHRHDKHCYKKRCKHKHNRDCYEHKPCNICKPCKPDDGWEQPPASIEIDGPTGHPSEIEVVLNLVDNDIAPKQVINSIRIDDQQFARPNDISIIDTAIEIREESTIMLMATLSLEWFDSGNFLLECETTIISDSGKTVTLPLMKKSIISQSKADIISINGSSLKTTMSGNIQAQVECQIMNEESATISHTLNGNMTLWSIPTKQKERK